MKKILCAVLCLILLFSICACSKNENTEPEETAAADVSQTQSESDSTTEPEKPTKKRSLKETVKITIPLVLLKEEEQKDLKAYCAEHGYKKAKINRINQTVTITMSALAHELLLTNVGMTVIKSLYEIASDKSYSYINQIESFDNDNFRSVVFSVNAKKYPKGSLASYMMAQSCMLYQLYTTDDDYRVDITVVDKKTGKEIETITYTDKEILKN